MQQIVLVILVILSGIASQYAPGKMEEVVNYRQTHSTAHPLPQVLPETDGMIAVLDCNEIGNVWLIRHNETIESFLVVDCAGDTQTINWMINNNIHVEVDGETAKRWNTVGTGEPIEVVKVLEVPQYQAE